MANGKKTTSIDLVAELSERNKDGKYDSIIARAKENGYHDYKIDDEKYPNCLCPKMDLVYDLGKFPELSDIRDRVKEGEFDEVMDESDKENLRAQLKANGEENLLEIFNL